MNRRELLAASAALLVAPIGHAQQVRRPFRVTHLSINSLETRRHLNDGLELGLRELGYKLGEDLVLEQAAGDGSPERLQILVRETVARNPDVIVTGANVVTVAVKSATQRIPIVMTLGTDVVDRGLVQSLPRPGGNVTGLTVDVGDGIAVKAVELLKEVLPRVSRVGVLWEPPHRDSYKPALDKAASALKLNMTWVQFSGDLERDFAEFQRARCEALHILLGTGIYRRAGEVAGQALRLRLPSISGISELVSAGGLMSYGVNFVDMYRRAARYVHQILKGAAPGELPVQQPTLINLEINLKTAKALGLKIPPSILLRADRVIE